MWLIEPFDRARHERSHFDCGNALLNRYLREQVSPHTRKGISRTYGVVEDAGDESAASSKKLVLGYYTLSAGSVTFEELTDPLRRRLPKHPMPIALIGRLAVHISYQGRGLGGVILFDALKRAVEISNEIGIAAVGVEAKDEQAATFCCHHGFKPLPESPRRLLLPIATAQHLMADSW